MGRKEIKWLDWGKGKKIKWNQNNEQKNIKMGFKGIGK